MDYASTLKALRAKLVESATGQEIPVQSTSLESFIASRSQEPENQESTDDIITRSANWVSEIKKASLAFQKAYGSVDKKSSSPVEEGVKGFLRNWDKKEEDEPFIAPREKSEDTEGESFVSRVKNSPIVDRIAKGYKEISQKALEQLIRSEAEARNIDPETAVAIFRSEGAGSYQSLVPREGTGSYNGLEDSHGPFQLYRGGGLGNEYEKKTGRNLREDNTLDGVTNQVRFALDKAVSQGWAPWYGRKTAGVGVWDGLKGAKALGNWK